MNRPVHNDGRRRAGAALTAAGIAVTGTGLLLGPGSSTASSHREAPLTAANPLAG